MTDMSKKKENNRMIILNSANRRPYGAKMTLIVEDYVGIKVDGECSLLVTPEIVLTLQPKEQRPYKPGSFWEIKVEGFSTAGEAERVGLKVALGFLWSVVKNNHSARLVYNTPLPCSVYDRTSTKGVSLFGHATLSVHRVLRTIVEPLDYILTSSSEVDQRLLVAVELLTSAKLETTERSKFVGIVSALEPLALQEKYKNSELESLISSFKTQIESSTLDAPIKQSLKGRIDQLRVESVSRAIRRLVKEKLPGDKESLDIVEEAYGLRSEILHNGITDADLSLKRENIERVVKMLIEKCIEEFVTQ
jgi:hypothetical protein